MKLRVIKMEKENRLLASKLDELEKQHLLMHARIFGAHNKSKQQNQTEIERLKDEIAEEDLLLQDTIAHGRSEALARLACVQQNYCAQMKKLSEDLYKYMGDAKQKKAEAFALYAEFAMDFAVQADRFALLAALEAINIQQEEMEVSL